MSNIQLWTWCKSLAMRICSLGSGTQYTCHQPVSVGIRQVLKIHQGFLWTNNNICCDRARLWLAHCGVFLKCVLPSNRVWCPGLFYRPVSSGSWGKGCCVTGLSEQYTGPAYIDVSIHAQEISGVCQTRALLNIVQYLKLMLLNRFS